MPRKIRRKKGQTFEDLLKCRFVASCTTMVRWAFYGQPIPEWIKNHVVVDFPIFMIHANNGKIKVMKDVFAQYNISNQGVSQQSQTPEYKDKMRKILFKIDAQTNFKHTNAITEYIKSTQGQ